ncbi:glycosyltransferase family A protein [Bacillus pumilus]|uniref:glycosyltransferase family A protein n=1 Tax=Bacillus pumilus TaxID=1408 RepID=UPI0021B2C4B3|nr:glycosyltransferase family A protein [Bacillus pumilus]
MDIKLSVLIPSTPERLTYLARMVSELERQSSPYPVEILVLIDNKTRTTGSKRNSLIEQAQGTYITFVDDDDRIETDYIQTIVEKINSHSDADCITFDVEVNLGGLDTKIAKYDVNYINSQDDCYYYRKPNHLMCYAQRIANQEKFLNISYGEDDEWAARVSTHIKNQIKIPRVLYYYDYVLKRPKNNPLLRNWENELMQKAIEEPNDPI